MIERLLAAEAAFERGEIDVAERGFTLVADTDSRNAIAVVGLARIARQRGDTVRARDLAERALGIDPHEAAARRLLVELDRPAEPGTPASPVSEGTPEGSATPPSTPRPWWRRLIDRLRGRT